MCVLQESHYHSLRLIPPFPLTLRVKPESDVISVALHYLWRWALTRDSHASTTSPGPAVGVGN